MVWLVFATRTSWSCSCRLCSTGITDARLCVPCSTKGSAGWGLEGNPGILSCCESGASGCQAHLFPSLHPFELPCHLQDKQKSGCWELLGSGRDLAAQCSPSLKRPYVAFLILQAGISTGTIVALRGEKYSPLPVSYRTWPELKQSHNLKWMCSRLSEIVGSL